MSWFTEAFTSSIGKKFIVGITGLFLCSFLLIHCLINSLIFANDGGELFNKGAEFMGTNVLIRTLEVVLFVGLLAHIVQTLILHFQNKKARPIGYAAQAGNANSKWYSRSMALLGTLILIFLILHLKHFWVLSRFTDHIAHSEAAKLPGQETLFSEMKEVFENPITVIIYVLAQISLAYHLLHGFQSAFQSLGLNHAKYTPFIKSVGNVFAIVIPTLFALMPIALYFEIIK
jgi:succinate dehydrogenase / fumarate reductase cytochrome b subunit